MVHARITKTPAAHDLNWQLGMFVPKTSAVNVWVIAFGTAALGRGDATAENTSTCATILSQVRGISIAQLLRTQRHL